MLNIFLLISTFLAYFVKAITGFGSTLVFGTLFSFAIPNKITTPVDLVFSIPTNIYMTWKNRKDISLKIVVPLSLMLLAGIIPGTFLLKHGSDWVLKSFLGIVIVGLAAEMYLRKPSENGAMKNNPLLMVVIGVVSGILAGLFGISALIVAYISRTTENRNQFRGNICCVFLVENIFRFFLYWFTGILQKEVFVYCLMLVPAVVIGMIAGIIVDRRIDEETVRRSTIGLLAVSGTVLFIKNILMH